jgi:hypothetical protein
MIQVTTETTDAEIKSLMRKRVTFTIEGVETVYPATRGYLVATSFGGSVKASAIRVINTIGDAVFSGRTVTAK